MKKIIGFIICTLLITATGFSVVGINEEKIELNNKSSGLILEGSPLPIGLFEWPTFSHDSSHSGYYPSLATSDNNVLWSANIGDWADSPAAIVNNKVYIAAMDIDGSYLYCFDAFSGEEIWMSEIHDGTWGSPTVTNNRIYLQGWVYNIYCIDADSGDIIWDYPEYGYGSPNVVNNKVYFGSYGGGFYCLNATTGDKIWDFDTSTDYEGVAPAVDNGKVYVGSNHHILYCLDADTGRENWNSAGKCSSFSSPTVADDKVYTINDRFYCLDADTGNELWNYPIIGNHPSPAVAYGNVYIPSVDYNLYALNAYSGGIIWQTEIGDIHYCSPVIADEKVYITTDDPAKIICLDAFTGDTEWSYELSSHTHASPAVAYGNVYIADGAGDFFVFGQQNEALETPSKPDGPDDGMTGVEYTFNSSTTDPEGDDIYYLFDWGDGDNTGWIGPYASGTIVDASHMWTEVGYYEIRVKAHDGRRESNWSNPLTIHIIEENNPPDAPSIDGPPSGKSGVEYEYTFVTTDPEEHDVFYYIDWGDGSFDEWIGPYGSGLEVTFVHAWDEQGTYLIKAKARDVFDAESDWGELTVTMPRNKPTTNLLLLRVLERYPLLERFLTLLIK